MTPFFPYLTRNIEQCGIYDEVKEDCRIAIGTDSQVENKFDAHITDPLLRDFLFLCRIGAQTLL